MSCIPPCYWKNHTSFFVWFDWGDDMQHPMAVQGVGVFINLQVTSQEILNILSRSLKPSFICRKLPHAVTSSLRI